MLKSNTTEKSVILLTKYENNAINLNFLFLRCFEIQLLGKDLMQKGEKKR